MERRRGYLTPSNSTLAQKAVEFLWIAITKVTQPFASPSRLWNSGKVRLSWQRFERCHAANRFHE